jgi:hypothetical protein
MVACGFSSSVDACGATLPDISSTAIDRSDEAAKLNLAQILPRPWPIDDCGRRNRLEPDESG